MNINSSFDEIRPYNDDELKSVLDSLVEEKGFIRFVKFLNSECNENSIRELCSKVSTIKEFQLKIISPIVKLIIDKTTNGLTYSGIDNLDPKRAYLFISNHRDIILDSSFINIILSDNGFETTEIAIGDNLLAFKWISDLVRINKSFIVHRNVSPRLAYEYSKQLSDYIRYSLTQKGSSIWLAQGEGRTKNGDDKTQSGLLKMLNISSDKGFIESYSELNIVPVSISYEYDSCDNLKVAELYARSENPDFHKSRKDDLVSMKNGISTQKGRVHFAFGKPVNNSLDVFSGITNKNELIKQMASLIDSRIYENYMLWSGNFIAYDIINISNKFADKYSINEKNEFVDYMNKSLSNLSGNKTKLEKLFLDIYSNPVINKIKQKFL